MNRKTLVIGAALTGFLILAAQAGTWQLARTEPLPSGTGFLSENGLYAARVAWGENPMQPVIGSFSLAGPDGRVLWSKTDLGENACFIANDGRTVVGMRGPGVEGLPASLTFYGPKGEKKADVTVKGLSGTAFSPDGSTFLVRSQDLGIGAFDRSGKKLWQVPGGRLFSPGPNGKVLAVEDQGTLFLYEQGRLTGKAVLGEPFAVALSFSPEGDRLAAVTSHKLSVLMAKGLGVVWTTEIKEPGKTFTSASLARDGKALAAGVGFDAGSNAAPENRYSKGEAVLYDAGGKPLWTQDITLGGFAPHRPLVSLTEDGGTIRAKGVDRIFVYQQQRKGGQGQ